MRAVPLSSTFSVVLRNFFHHDTNSLLDGGETAAAGGESASAPRCAGCTIGGGRAAEPTPPVAMVSPQVHPEIHLRWSSKDVPDSERRPRLDSEINAVVAQARV